MSPSRLRLWARNIFATVAVLVIAAASGTQARAQVVVGSTFDIAVTGFNSGQTAGIFLATPVDLPFGTTQTFNNSALGGQVLTVSSSEVVGATNITDTITISVPTNFIPAGTVSTGTTPVQVAFAELGGGNAGTDLLKFQTPLPAGYANNTSLVYSGGTLSLGNQATGNDQLSNGNMSLSSAAGVSAGGTDLSGFDINEFQFQIVYPIPAVPEPSSLVLLGVGGLIPMLRRRRAIAN
jgi:PEP-CTERM motif